MQVEKTAKQAQGRLWLNRWLSAAGWSLAAAAGVFAAAVMVLRLSTATEQGAAFFGLLAGAATGLALVGSSIWLLITRESLSAAATRLDQAAALKERISSALYCKTTDDPFARAVVVDAEQVARKVVVPLYIPVRTPASAAYAGLGLLLALLVFWLFPVVGLAGRDESARKQQEQKHLVAQAKAIVQPRVEQQINKIAEQNPALKKDLEALEPPKEAKLDTPFDVRREQMKRIENIREKWENRRESGELAQVKEFKNITRRLAAQQQNKSPVGELSKALSQGDFQAAQAALAALQKELAKPPSTPQEQQRADELKEQLKQLSKELGKLAADNKKNRDALARAGLKDEQIAQALENLKKGDIEALKKQLAERGLPPEQVSRLADLLQRRCGACQSAGKLAGSLGLGSGGMDQNSQKGLEGLSAAGEQLSQLEAMEQELKELGQGLAGLNEMRNELGQVCSACNGTGILNGQPCSACGGTGMGMLGTGGSGSGMGGLGRGMGGLAPKQATNFALKSERTQVHSGPGRIISQQWVDGEQFKNEVSNDFVEANIAAQREVSEAIAREQIPRHYHGAIKTYFSHSLEALPADKVKAAEEKAGGNNP